MKRKTKLANLLMALATSGMLLQIDGCGLDVSTLIFNAGYQITQVLAASFLNSLFSAVGQAAGLPQGSITSG